MTNEEFSAGFDVYMNSYSQSIGDPLIIGGLNFDEYEKSLFLTDAQEQFIKHLYKGGYGVDGFEESEELRRQLDSLVIQQEYTSNDAFPTEKDANEQISSDTLIPANPSVLPIVKGVVPVIKDGKTHTVFKLNDDCWYIVYENALNGSNDSCTGGMSCDVVPISHDVYNRTRNNPFRGPNNSRVLRLDRGKYYVELVSAFPIKNYIVRYIKRPDPIILTSLEGTPLSIYGEQKETSCTLNDVVHREILELAVKLAYASRAQGSSSKTKKDSDED